jgi:hypothetical protein
MTVPPRPAAPRAPSPLAVLPTSSVLRSYLVTRLTSSPTLLAACFAVLRRMLDPRAVLLSPERNRALRWLFKHSFYAQFCAGENKREVQRTVARVKAAGYTGVILELALEVLKGEAGAARTTAEEIAQWRRGMIETVDMSAPGDFIALKWSGLGREAQALLDRGADPTPEMRAAVREVCDLAAARGAALLPGAELEATNAGIDRWTLDLQRVYNAAPPPAPALMYTTYQAYLRSTPARLARDLAAAAAGDFTLGVKLVRGAYLASEPAGAAQPGKPATDAAYDGLAAAVLTRRWNAVLPPPFAGARFPRVAVMLATHNAASVAAARRLRVGQARGGEEMVPLAYAQLQGMADEISCELVAASKRAAEGEGDKGEDVDRPRPFKCATWGTVGECLNFLYRRALENQDAAGRTEETRRAMGRELAMRWKAFVGLG